MNSINPRKPGEEFGAFLKYYRQRTLDPTKKGICLTQARLAELADCGISGAMVGHWETGQRTIKHQDRTILCTLIKVLHQYGGIATLSEANELLEKGLYSRLAPEEIQEINPNWFTERAEPSSFPLPQSPITVILSLKTVTEWLDGVFRWSEADNHARSSWAGMFIRCLSAVIDRITIDSWFNFLMAVILWIGASLLMIPILQWPLDNPVTRVRASILFAVAFVSVPSLIALLTVSDLPVDQLENTRQQKQTHFLLKLTGAVVGFSMMATLLFLLTLGIFYLEQSLSSYWWAFTLLAPLFMSYIGARRIPADRYKMYGRLQLHPADPLFLAVFLLLGSGIGIFVYAGYEVLTNKVVGMSFLMILTGTALWYRQKRSPIPDFLLIFIVGTLTPLLVLFLFLYVSPSEETVEIVRSTTFSEQVLVFIYFISFTTAGVAVLLRNPPTIILPGALGLLLIVLSLCALLQLDLFWGRFATFLTVLLWAVWGKKRFRSYFWIHASVGFLLLALVSSLFLAARTNVPIWANLVSYTIVSTGLITWAYWSGNRRQDQLVSN